MGKEYCSRCEGERAADDECLYVDFGDWSDCGPASLLLCDRCEKSLAEWIDKGQDEDYRGDDPPEIGF